MEKMESSGGNHLLLEDRTDSQTRNSNESLGINLRDPSVGSNSNTAAIHIGDLIREKEREKEFYHSFELVSPRGEEEASERETKNKCAPLFFAFTWHGTFAENCRHLQHFSRFPKNTLLHLTAKGLRRQDVEYILKKILNLGITNLLVLRGDDPPDNGDFPYAVDLIKFIRSLYNDKFCIGVAGYPDTHPESPSRESDLYYLKKKVNAGASFVITQILFESRGFIRFVEDCRSCGIDVPIIPGIIVISNYKAFMKLEKNCNLTVPKKIHEDLSKIDEKNDEIRDYGINLATRIVQEILSTGIVHGYHLFTLNKLSEAQHISSNLIRKLRHPSTSSQN
ncbi:5,10-methylenetetrahydrofolate reductase [Diachasmimorpha longicaudata]|uniref:5,10-methylenetetrahydrofolate reductase n=1 Tax=Diachasmimorpha longicaudata TaxID=58733 RepID=UPI0030B91C60